MTGTPAMIARRPTPAQLRRGEALWGEKPTAAIEVVGFKPVSKNTLVGFAAVRFGALTLLDCPVHVHQNGRSWVALPSKPVLDQEGQHKRDISGKLQYQPIAEWRDRAASDRFSAAVIASLRERYSEALGDAS